MSNSVTSNTKRPYSALEVMPDNFEAERTKWQRGELIPVDGSDPSVLSLRTLHADLLKLIFIQIHPHIRPPLFAVCRRWKFEVSTLPGSRARANPTLAMIALYMKWDTLFKWAIERKAGQSHHSKEAARLGNLPALQLLHAKGLVEDSLSTCHQFWSHVAQGGNVEMVKWLATLNMHPNGSLSLQSSILKAVASSGHLPLLRYLKEEIHMTFPGGICDSAAASGNVEMLRWLKTRNLKISYNTARMAIQGGHLEALKWLHQEGVPLFTEDKKESVFSYAFFNPFLLKGALEQHLLTKDELLKLLEIDPGKFFGNNPLQILFQHGILSRKETFDLSQIYLKIWITNLNPICIPPEIRRNRLSSYVKHLQWLVQEGIAEVKNKTVEFIPAKI